MTGVRFDKINLQWMNNVRAKTMKNATWRGTLLALMQQVIMPIASGKVAVSKEIRREALKLQGELNIRLLDLPETKTTPAPVPQMPERVSTLPIMSEKIVGGNVGEIDGAKFLQDPRVAAASVAGTRPGNQDGLLIARDGSLLIVVADGMGGESKGEVASEKAVTAIEDEFIKDPNAFSLDDSFIPAHLALMAENQKIAPAEMGTTIVGALIRGEKLYIASSGDSRGYLIRGGRPHLLTRDDTSEHRAWEADMKNAGVAITYPLEPGLTEDHYDSTKGKRDSSVIKALGLMPSPATSDGKRMIIRLVENPIPPSSLTVDLQAGDIVVLCSDGLHGYADLNKAVMKAINDNQDKSPLEIAQALIATLASPSDNVSVAVYKHPSTKVVVTPEDPDKAVDDEAKTRIFQIVTTPERLDQIIAEAKAEIDRKSGVQVAKLQAEIADLNRKIQDLTTAAQLLEAENGRLIKSVGQTPESLLALRVQLSKLLENRQSLQQRLAGVKREYSAEQKKVNFLHRTLASLPAEMQGKTAGSQAEMDRAKTDFEQTTATDEIKALREEVRLLGKRIAELKELELPSLAEKWEGKLGAKKGELQLAEAGARTTFEQKVAKARAALQQAELDLQGDAEVLNSAIAGITASTSRLAEQALGIQTQLDEIEPALGHLLNDQAKTTFISCLSIVEQLLESVPEVSRETFMNSVLPAMRQLIAKLPINRTKSVPTT